MDQDSGNRRHGGALAGVAAVTLAVGAGRWGSYLGAPPLFLTDVLLAAGVWHYTTTRLAFHDDPSVFATERPHRALVLFSAWVVARFVVALRVDLDALRDFAPYLYSILGIVAALSLARAGAKSRERTATALLWALAFHAAWVFLVTVIAPDLPLRLPMLSAVQGLHVFGLRPDTDMSLMGVLAAWLLVRVIRGRRPWRSFLGLLACWAAILSPNMYQTRGGTLGAVVAGMLAVLVALGSGTGRSARRTMLVAVIPLMFVGAMAVLPETTAGQRFVGTFGSAGSSEAGQASGTTGARERTYRHLWQYATESPKRAAVGVGFGPDFMVESGASYLLTGSEGGGATDPRSPHNYWLTTLIRLGAIGLALFAALMLSVVARMKRLVPVMGDQPLLLLAALIVSAFVIPMSVGVVLESPFGAVPFFWCVGLLLAWPKPNSGPGVRRTRTRGTAVPSSRSVDGEWVCGTDSATSLRRTLFAAGPRSPSGCRGTVGIYRGGTAPPGDVPVAVRGL